MFGISQFVPGTNGWAPGDGKRLMTPPGTPAFIALICYEAIFSGDLGADPADAAFILNITNDAWFDGSIGPAQHAHHAKLRAVETGLPLVRVGNTGITLLTDPLGRVTEQLAPQGMRRPRRRAGPEALRHDLQPHRHVAVLDRDPCGAGHRFRQPPAPEAAGITFSANGARGYQAFFISALTVSAIGAKSRVREAYFGQFSNISGGFHGAPVLLLHLRVRRRGPSRQGLRPHLGRDRRSGVQGGQEDRDGPERGPHRLRDAGDHQPGGDRR